MTLNPRNPRTRPRWLLSAATVGFLSLFVAGVALANLGLGTTFELDGNPTDPTPPAGGNRNAPDDWSAIYPLPADPPVGYLDEEFVDDHAAIDETYFTGGSSKDDINIDTTAGTPGSGGWLRDKTSSAQPKADIIDAFAASYQVGGETVVYFGMDRYSNDGATFAGFWFLQNSISFGATAQNGVGEINGSHVPGDILVITDFTQGGAVEKLNVYEWVGPNSGLPGVINGVFILKFAGTDCDISGPDADACSNVNSTAVTSPWPFVPKSNVGPAGTFQPGLFIEGGVNISDLFPGQDPCFTNFVAETRASFSLDSTLSDFAAGTFNTCGGIEALKYHDLNANGSKGASEPVLSGWTIYIDSNGNSAFDAGEPTGVTGADGKVLFSSLTAGSHKVCEVNQANWINSDPGGGTLCQTVVVGTGGAVATVDFGNYQNVTVKVIKYHDLNANGSQQAGEPFLQNWNFYIENGANEAQDLPGDGAYQATNASGETTFTLTPGAAYKICEELQANWVNSDPSGATICESTATIVSGTAQSDLVFGNYQNVTVKVIKYHDRNADGVRDANGIDNILGGAGAADDEVLLPGWEFYVEVGANEIHNDGIDGVKQTTDANGETTFSLAPGAAYKICEVLQANWVNTDPSGVTICESTATIVSGQAQADLIYGNHPEYRVIVLTCNEATGQLVVSSVDLDGVGATYSTLDSIGTPPALTGKTPAELQTYLCNLGGAQYNDLAPQTFNNGKVILPK